MFFRTWRACVFFFTGCDAQLVYRRLQWPHLDIPVWTGMFPFIPAPLLSWSVSPKLLYSLGFFLSFSEFFSLIFFQYMSQTWLFTFFIPNTFGIRYLSFLFHQDTDMTARASPAIFDNIVLYTFSLSMLSISVSWWIGHSGWSSHMLWVYLGATAYGFFEHFSDWLHMHSQYTCF